MTARGRTAPSPAARPTRSPSACPFSPIRTWWSGCGGQAPLNAPDKATFYGGDARGYTDYPTLAA
jgi:hypothetical protein